MPTRTAKSVSTNVIPLPVAQQPQPVREVKVLLSEADMWFIAKAMFAAPWNGGEQAVMEFSAIHTTLKLDTVDQGKPYAKCSRSTKPYILTTAQIDLLIAVMCSVGFKGEVGPTYVKIVQQLRALVNKAKQG